MDFTQTMYDQTLEDMRSDVRVGFPRFMVINMTRKRVQIIKDRDLLDRDGIIQMQMAIRDFENEE